MKFTNTWKFKTGEKPTTSPIGDNVENLLLYYVNGEWKLKSKDGSFKNILDKLEGR